jgi:helicase required for RNAi-mediated heterochromatin assembly 1
LGGRSKDEEVKKRTLYEVRTSLPQQKQPGSQRVQGILAMKKLTSSCLTLLQPLEATGTPLDHRVLLELGIITKDQADSLETELESMMGMSTDNTPGIMLEQWLGRFIAVCQRPVLPDDFEGGAWEEEEFE